MPVKLDYERDYYADLELPPTADATEVKKQYKKLALKWHPDRNPGKEDAARDKFLVIQSAFEVLTDSALKAKFDAYRRRSTTTTSRFPTASGVRGNPYQNVSQDMADRFGAPPTRRGPQMPTRPAAATPNTSRYTSWGVPPSSAKQKMGNPRDNLRAWENMRSASGSGTGVPPTPTAKKPEQPRPPPPTPRTASQARRQEAAFGTRRAGGFAPASPMGDEPPVTNKNYSTGNTRTNIFEEAAKNSARQSGFADPLSEQLNDTFLDSRQRTPYASHVGEKFNPFEGTNVNRAKSVRDGYRTQQGADETPARPTRQRSASVGESDGFRKTPNKESAGFNIPATGNPSRFTSQASASYSPRASESKTAGATPASSTEAVNGTAKPAFGSGTSTNVNGGPSVYATPAFGQPSFAFETPLAHKSREVPKPKFQATVSDEDDGNSPTHRPSTRSRADSSSKTPHSYSRVGGEESVARRTRTQGRSTYRSYSSRSNRDARSSAYRNRTPSGDKMNPFEQCLNDQLHSLFGKLKGLAIERQHAEDSTPKPVQESSKRRHDGPSESHRVVKQRTNSTSRPGDSFSMPVTEDMFGGGPAKFKSADNINTRFVAEENQASGVNYAFNAGGATGSGEDLFMKAKQRARAAPRGRKSPLKNTFSSSSESLPNEASKLPKQDDQPQQQANAAAAAQQQQGTGIGGFDAHQWAQKFGPQHFFVPPPVNKPNVSPTRSNRSIKRKPVKMTAGTAGLVDDEETSSEDKTRPGTSTPSAEEFMGVPGGPENAPSPNAMDIDPPVPPVTIPVPPPTNAQQSVPLQQTPVAAPPPQVVPESGAEAHGARKINVEPSKPEWRAGDVNGVSSKGSESAAQGASASIPTAPPVFHNLNPKAENSGTKSPPIPANRGSEDSEEFMGSVFSELKNVEPIAQPKPSGLNNFGDMKRDLPFQSQASARVHTDRERERAAVKPKTLNFPQAPLAPRPPAALGVQGLKPAQQSWQKYVAEFDSYLRAWAMFNKRIVDHFAARHRVVDELEAPRGRMHTMVVEGRMDEYLRWMEEDKIVRGKWADACEVHEHAVRDFQEHWKRMNRS